MYQKLFETETENLMSSYIPSKTLTIFSFPFLLLHLSTRKCSCFSTSNFDSCKDKQNDNQEKMISPQPVFNKSNNFIKIIICHQRFFKSDMHDFLFSFWNKNFCFYWKFSKNRILQVPTKSAHFPLSLFKFILLKSLPFS